ncbi:MAG TPA: extracellular solute-binding protein [Virgibacillus sp.]|nr:extracellular solute-binding protein [Virgibacillus sp.]HLR68517.1 extracellular solute-binding protein [Virgibacillus sp.]
MKKIRFKILSAITLLSVGILSACGNNANQGSDTSDNNTNNAGEGNSITIWTNLQNEADVLTDYAEKWGEETGNVVEVVHETPDIQQFAQASKSENGPDGIFGIANDQLANYMDAGLVEEVPEDTFSDDDYVDASVQAIYFEGKRYGVPIAVETNTLFYNTDKVEEAPETWDELTSVANENGGIQFEATSIYYDLGFLRAFDSYIFNYSNGEYNVEDIGLGNKGAIEAYEYINNLANEYNFFDSDITSDIAKGNFQSGETAFYIGGPWDIDGFEAAGTPFSVAPMPMLNDNNFVTPVGTQIGFVSSESPDREVVWDFYKYVLENASNDLYEVGGRIPAQIEAQESIETNDFTDAFITQVSYGEPLPTVSEIGQVWTPFLDNIKLMIEEQITAEEAANYIEQQVQEGIEMMNSGQ